MTATTEQERRLKLRRMRTIATGLLIVAAILYLVTLRDTRTGWLGYVNAGAEAAMVGGIADWFAVTAIFRHPLGIPIPHTALVRRRKDDLGRSIQHFAATNFLTTQNVVDKLLEAGVAERLGRWLSVPDHRIQVLDKVAHGVRAILGRVKDSDVTDLLTSTVVPTLEAKSWSPIAGVFLDKVIAEDGHRPVIDLLAGETHDWLVAHPELTKQVIQERVPGWLPGFLDRRLTDYAYQQAVDWARAVGQDPDHPVRLMIDRFLTRLAFDLQHDEATMARAETFKQRLLHNSGTLDTAMELWGSLRGALEKAIDDRDSALWHLGDTELTGLSTRLTIDSDLRARWDGRIADAAALLFDTYGDELASVVSTTVERWDATDASNKIELFVGKDLQYIRINGTVVGALVGILIHAFSQLMQLL